MASKLGLIIKREYLAKVRNRSFVVITILSPLLIVGMIVLIAYLAKINDNDVRVVTVLNESGYFQEDLKASLMMFIGCAKAFQGPHRAL